EAKTDEEEWRDDLIQANVESVFCEFTDNLGDYYTKMKSSIQDPRFLKDMLKADQEKAPEGKGWVVEVRGYTYHRDTYDFVTKVVVNNFARLPLKDVKPEGGDKGTGDAAKTTPPTPAPAPAPATKDQAVDKGKEATKDPITNQVSHAVLFRY